MRLYKEYTKESYLFLVSSATLSLDNPLLFRKKIIIKWVLVRKLKQLIT